ncbi:MAG: aminotransferase class I/II-fold pyridoxal phosphate-dependent enzyme [Kiritimatiellae bacterium]|nr:aminotransferase class I/II-fold pyridoxal phosphate-dependent enzyme [Kiritimatiellia bacterium]
MAFTAKRIRDLKQAGIRVLFDAAQGIEDVIHLEIGKPDFPTPAPICEAAIEAIRQGRTTYTPNAGVQELRRDLAAHLTTSKGVAVSPREIVVTTGGMGALATTLEAILEPGDEVLVPNPGWPNYAMQTICAGGTAVTYDLSADTGYQPERRCIEPRITDRTKALLVNSPANPTGAVISAENVAGLVDLARQHNLLIVSDECYEDILYVDSCPSFLREDSRAFTVGIYSFSKTYAMTGWRIGYLAAPPELAPQITKLQEVYVACASSVSQAAARAALALDRRHVREMVQAYARRREIVREELQAAGIRHFLPQGAFYCLVDIGATGTDSMAFALELLKTRHVAVAPGETFGRNAARTVRICFATGDETLREGVRRLAAFAKRK